MSGAVLEAVPPAATRVAGAKIAILLPDLRGGGVERMRLHLADEFLAAGHAVSFWLLKAEGPLLGMVPEGAEVVDLEAPRLRSAAGPVARQWRAERPDAVLAAMWPLTDVAALAKAMAGAAGRRSRLVVSEHNTLSLTPQAKGLLKRAAMRATIAAGHRAADAVVGVSEGVCDDVAALGGMDRRRLHTIYNPAAAGRNDGRPMSDPWPAPPGGRVLSVGTLKDQKDVPTLLRAMARVRGDAMLCVLGEGSERPRLEALVRELKLEGRVLLPGFAADPAPWYAHADAFALASRYEGFGNVLVEALEFGLPVAATDCRSGPSEILAGGAYGRLVPVGDDAALAAAIDQTLTDPADPDRLKARAAEFTPRRVATRYLDLLLPKGRPE